MKLQSDYWAVWASSVLLFSAACSVVDSKDVNTDGLRADFNVTAEGDGLSVVQARLVVGDVLSGTVVNLGDGDTLRAKSNSDEQVMSETHDILNDYIYVATFEGDDENKAFTISLDRSGTAPSAPDSEASLPAEFSITSPTASATFSRAQDLTVAWNAAVGDSETVSVQGDCFGNISAAATGTSYVLAASSLVANKGQESASCVARITVTQSRNGTVDPAFGNGGTFQGRRTQSIDIVSAP